MKKKNETYLVAVKLSTDIKNLLCKKEDIEKSIRLGAPFRLTETVTIEQMFNWLANPHGVKPTIYLDKRTIKYMTNCWDGIDKSKGYYENIESAVFGVIKNCLNCLDEDK